MLHASFNVALLAATSPGSELHARRLARRRSHAATAGGAGAHHHTSGEAEAGAKGADVDATAIPALADLWAKAVDAVQADASAADPAPRGDHDHRVSVAVHARRARLITAPRVAHALLRFWQLSGRTDEETLERESFVDIYALIIRALGDVPSEAPEADARRLATADFVRDARGAGHGLTQGLSMASFCAALFLLAETWVEAQDEGEYVAFLASLYRRISRVDSVEATRLIKGAVEMANASPAGPAAAAPLLFVSLASAPRVARAYAEVLPDPWEAEHTDPAQALQAHHEAGPPVVTALRGAGDAALKAATKGASYAPKVSAALCTALSAAARVGLAASGAFADAVEDLVDALVFEEAHRAIGAREDALEAGQAGAGGGAEGGEGREVSTPRTITLPATLEVLAMAGLRLDEHAEARLRALPEMATDPPPHRIAGHHHSTSHRESDHLRGHAPPASAWMQGVPAGSLDARVVSLLRHEMPPHVPAGASAAPSFVLAPAEAAPGAAVHASPGPAPQDVGAGQPETSGAAATAASPAFAGGLFAGAHRLSALGQGGASPLAMWRPRASRRASRKGSFRSGPPSVPAVIGGPHRPDGGDAAAHDGADGAAGTGANGDAATGERARARSVGATLHRKGSKGKMNATSARGAAAGSRRGSRAAVMEDVPARRPSGAPPLPPAALLKKKSSSRKIITAASASSPSTQHTTPSPATSSSRRGSRVQQHVPPTASRAA